VCGCVYACVGSYADLLRRQIVPEDTRSSLAPSGVVSYALFARLECTRRPSQRSGYSAALRGPFPDPAIPGPPRHPPIRRGECFTFALRENRDPNRSLADESVLCNELFMPRRLPDKRYFPRPSRSEIKI